MEQAVEDYATMYADVQFIKIDADKLEVVAKEFMVEAMPTFVFVKKGKEVDRIARARKAELKRMMEKHRTSN
ncbi:hypothetical protein PTKIN_Ptkin02bG0097400 [Pterospermum kingtungense]